MSIALVGLISFQLYWINNAIHLSQERFEKDVFESLHVVADKLERKEMMMVASQSYAYVENISTGPEKEHTQVDVKIDTKVKTEHGDTLNEKVIKFQSNDGDVQLTTGRLIDLLGRATDSKMVLANSNHDRQISPFTLAMVLKVGGPSICPELMVRMFLGGYCYSIWSELRYPG